MAKVIITFKIMPEDPEVDLNSVKEKAELEIKQFGGEIGKTEEVPVGFGLKSLNITFVASEDLGGTDDLEAKITSLEGVQGCETIDCRRALG